MSKTIYCELEFLRELVGNIPQVDPLGDNEKYKSWKKTYDLLKRNSVIFDELLSDEELKKIKSKNNEDLASEAMWTIIRDNFSISNSFHLLRAKKYEQLTNGQLQSIYLMILNKKEKQEISQSTGILIIGKPDMEKYNSLFSERKVPLPEGKYNNWNDLDYPESIRISNCLIIVDNYILRDTKKFEKNIYSLLDVLLPFQISVEYNISLYVDVNKSNLTESQMQLRFDYINNKIKELRPDLSYSLEIIDANEHFHDRKIITNNIYIRSGAGFDVFPIKKSTDVIMSFPFLENTPYMKDEESYNILISELNSIDHTKKYGKHIWYEKDSGNRLLLNL